MILGDIVKIIYP